MAGISIAKSLEQTLLHQPITLQDVEAGCELAASLHLASVCVFPAHVAAALNVLQGTDTKVCAAVGFPFGMDGSAAACSAISYAQSAGAHEINVMCNVAASTAGDTTALLADLADVSAQVLRTSLTTTRATALLTITLETLLMEVGECHALWDSLSESPIEFVQTASGFHSHTVTETDIQELRAALPETVAIKAAGNIATRTDALAMLNAGAVRIASGAAIVIAQEDAEHR